MPPLSFSKAPASRTPNSTLAQMVLARQLIAMGVGPESLVGLSIRRSLDLMVGLYAIAKAGGAWVPVDPDHPADRTAYILESAQPTCVVTTARDDVDLPSGTRVIEIDTLDYGQLDSRPIVNADRLSPLHFSNTAYVIYTSGSTGRPKGVAVTHAAINNQLQWMNAEYGLSASDIYLQKTATTFDVSLWGFFMPLQVGATLVVATPDGPSRPDLRGEQDRGARRHDHRLRAIHAHAVHCECTCRIL